MPADVERRGEAGPRDAVGSGGRGGQLYFVTVALLVGGMACFGTATPVSTLVGRAFPVWLASALRMASAAAILVPVLAWRAGTGAEEDPVATLRSTDAGDRWLLAGIAVVGTFLSAWPWCSACAGRRGPWGRS